MVNIADTGGVKAGAEVSVTCPSGIGFFFMCIFMGGWSLKPSGILHWVFFWWWKLSHSSFSSSFNRLKSSGDMSIRGASGECTRLDTGICTGGAMNGVFSFKSGGCEGISVVYTGGAINGVLGVNGGISDEGELGCGCRSEAICD